MLCYLCHTNTNSHSHCQACFILVGSDHLEKGLRWLNSWAVREDLANERAGIEYFHEQRYKIRLEVCADCHNIALQKQLLILPPIEMDYRTSNRG